MQDRLVAFDRILNFRDFGGWDADGGRIARGVLFRSASFQDATDADIAKIVDTYHAWLGLPSPTGRRAGDEGDPAAVKKYEDVAGFCRSATTQDIASHSWVLTPGRYVGAEEVEDDGEPFDEKMPRLISELETQFMESAKLEAEIRANLRGIFSKSEK